MRGEMVYLLALYITMATISIILILEIVWIYMAYAEYERRINFLIHETRDMFMGLYDGIAVSNGLIDESVVKVNRSGKSCILHFDYWGDTDVGRTEDHNG